MGWFGNLGLAWKYTLVFGVLLLATLIAGAIKVMFDRRKLKKHMKLSEIESAHGGKEDQVQLNGREKDEGDLFGVRAIEAGFFGGVAQSRPTSLAGTPNSSRPGTPSMSSHTLVGSFASPKVVASTPSASVTSLPLVRTHSGINLDAASPSKSRKVPPTISINGGGLQPSHAQINGRINHSNTVDMNLTVPPSPVHSETPRSTSTSPDPDSPRSLSPHSNHSVDLRTKASDAARYIQVSQSSSTLEYYGQPVHAVSVSKNRIAGTRSQEASFESGREKFQSNSRSASPGPGQYELPTMPQRAVQNVYPRSLSPSPGREQVRGAPVAPSSTRSSSSIGPPTQQASQISHARDLSTSSSTYSAAKTGRPRESHESAASFNFFTTAPDASSKSATNPPSQSSRNGSRRPSDASSSVGPSVAGRTSNDRFSDFFDAYYRNSHIAVASKAEAPKRPPQLSVIRQSTLEEVPSPEPSPLPDAIDSSRFLLARS
ncbi:hypothetical protein W97_07638 [Coniosporium apollinis CBS 100218]|uniref:Uncharacterized protein n=1 Tax=Coniosporium apollinis (strain CBS 100218) TaxID=1168221 RepID=R7Z2F7_CONA1|nr:uncharacterized protein W97_07638 [Coniosporium apollinis CBS 100218]EON68380.1 hypothetical protein W97_07638 [Coniosporium apollinis CBS 100218]